jgi:hypothetical protein
MKLSLSIILSYFLLLAQAYKVFLDWSRTGLDNVAFVMLARNGGKRGDTLNVPYGKKRIELGEYAKISDLGLMGLQDSKLDIIRLFNYDRLEQRAEGETVVILFVSQSTKNTRLTQVIK